MRSVKEAAEAWGVSITTVYKWIGQKRIKTKKIGRSWIVLSKDRPEPLTRGDLTPKQRAGWDYGTAYVPTDGEEG